MNRIEKAHEAFMEVIDELKKNGEYFANGIGNILKMKQLRF